MAYDATLARTCASHMDHRAMAWMDALKHTQRAAERHGAQHGNVPTALHHTPYDGDHVAYVVCILWGLYGDRTVGKYP
jgi:hypothetical protein